MSITDFLNARIAEDEAVAWALLADLSAQVEEEHSGQVDEKGPMTPSRLLSAQMWAQYDGQSKRRSFAKGQQIATLANPARVLAECAAKRAIVEAFNTTDLESEDRGAYFYAEGIGDAVKILAAVYADHPAYRDEWRVGSS